MSETIYRINKAGLYVNGHLQSSAIRLELGQPATCRAIELSRDQAVGLLNILGIRWENGVFLSEALTGEVVMVSDNQNGHPLSIGDPYGNGSVSLVEAR